MEEVKGNDTKFFAKVGLVNPAAVGVSLPSYAEQLSDKYLLNEVIVMQTITLQLPNEIYTRLELAASAIKQPLETVLLRIVETSLPPLDDTPPEFQKDIEALETMNDEELWEVMLSKVPPTQQRKLHRLLNKNQSGTLTPREGKELESLQFQADKVMLRKAHAAVLLKWRGHRIPTPEELQKQST